MFQELYNQSREEFDEMKASSAEIEKLLEMELEQVTSIYSFWKFKEFLFQNILSDFDINHFCCWKFMNCPTFWEHSSSNFYPQKIVS